ncbi:hypothetical protein Q9233_017155 [Columba guinea]|nr:hypothetical protein Q9233_017155 [Columba guinea]
MHQGRRCCKPLQPSQPTLMYPGQGHHHGHGLWLLVCEGTQEHNRFSFRTVEKLRGNLAVATLFLSLDGLTLAVAQKTSIWMMSSVKEPNLTFGTVLMLAGTHMTVDTMRMLESSVQLVCVIKKQKDVLDKIPRLVVASIIDFESTVVTEENAESTVYTVSSGSTDASSTTTEDSTTSETPTTLQTVSETTGKSSISPTPLIGDGGTSTPEITSTPTRGSSITEGDYLTPSSPVTDATEPSTPTLLTTLNKAVSPTPEPEDITTSATKMWVLGRLVLLPLIAALVLAEDNLIELNGTPRCGASFNQPSKAFNIELNANENCVWQIQRNTNQSIRAIFSYFHLELDRNCRFDFTAVYDGPTTNTGLIGKVCGRTQTSFESSSNAMTVVLSTDDSNSYRGFSAQYTSVPLPAPVQPDASLTCSSDSMTIVLSKSYLASLGYNETHLHLNDPSCRPVVTDSVIFSFPLSSCGTIKQDEGQSITYTNVVFLSPTGNVITRQKSVEIIAKCKMENNSTVEIMYITKNNIIQNITSVGRYNVSISFYDSESFSNPILESPYYIDLNQTIFTQVSLHSTDPNLLVFVDTCIASPQSDFGSPTYDLIRSGCNKDDTVVTYPPLEHYGRFKFNAFRFLRYFPSVYLQCDIVICDSNDTNSRCTRGCISRQKRDIPSYVWKTNTVVGPIRLKRDLRSAGASESLTKPDAEETPNLQQHSFYTLSFVVLISNIIIVVAVILKYHIKHQAGYSYQKLQSSY